MSCETAFLKATAKVGFFFLKNKGLESNFLNFNL